MEKYEIETPPEQIVYAKILEKGMYIGLLLLFLTYFMYVLGIMEPYTPFDQLSHCWTLKVHEYVEEANIPTGWAWVGMLKYGDFFNFIGIAVLAGVTIICFLFIVPTLFKEKDYLYMAIAILQALILTFAASGILKVGH